MTSLQTITDFVPDTSVESEEGFAAEGGNGPRSNTSITSSGHIGVPVAIWHRPTVTPRGNEPEPELKAWARLARRARARWARENPS